VLTAAYNAIYSGENGKDELILLTAPLSATMEVQALYDSGIIDWATALPVAMHSLGASSSDIAEAVYRRQKQEDDKEKRADEDRATQKRAENLEFRGKEIDLKHASAPAPKPAAAPSGGSSGGAKPGSGSPGGAKPAAPAAAQAKSTNVGAGVSGLAQLDPNLR